MECLLGADNLVIFQAMAKLSTSLLSLLSVLPEALTGTAKKRKEIAFNHLSSGKSAWSRNQYGLIMRQSELAAPGSKNPPKKVDQISESLLPTLRIAVLPHLST